MRSPVDRVATFGAYRRANERPATFCNRLDSAATS
jgi:hypothetical protein